MGAERHRKDPDPRPGPNPKVTLAGRLDGFDDDALEGFKQAKELTPENITIDVWIGGIRRSMREPAPRQPK